MEPAGTSPCSIICVGKTESSDAIPSSLPYLNLTKHDVLHRSIHRSKGMVHRLSIPTIIKCMSKHTRIGRKSSSGVEVLQYIVIWKRHLLFSQIIDLGRDPDNIKLCHLNSKEVRTEKDWDYQNVGKGCRKKSNPNHYLQLE